MRNLFPIIVCAVLTLSSCENKSDTPQQTVKSAAVEESKTPAPAETDNRLVVLNKITDGVWLHTSSQDVPGYGVVPSNGLAVKNGDEIILVNTAWGELATVELIDKIKAETGLEVKKLIVGHFHPDSLAGLDWLESKGVEVFAHPSTPGLSAQRGTPIPNTSVPELAKIGTRVKVGPVEVSYPGPAHTEDNLMAYVTGPKILYGGCMIRAANHKSLGNLTDANIEKWPDALKWAKQTYPETKMTIPSHGNPEAGITLIDHSLGLLEKHKNQAKK